MVFPGLRRTTTLAAWKLWGKCSKWKLASASSVIRSAAGGPQAFSRPAGSLSVPRAFYRAIFVSASVIFLLLTLRLS